MRRLIYAINTSIDGVCDHTKVPPPDNEVGDYYTRLVRDSGVFVYGRVTYQLMVPYWPDIAKNRSGDKWDLEFAEAFESVSKVVVFSRSLARAEEARTRIVRGNLKDEVLKLKEEPGKDILVGGVSIPAQLTELGLIDEYRILVNPAVVGEGKRLFDDVNLPQRLQLKLVDSRTFKSGCVLLSYMKQ
jgi:dihydrofolate reductase